jgi:hypothetical protein
MVHRNIASPDVLSAPAGDRSTRWLAWGAAAALALVGCAATDTSLTCETGAECASGACRDGLCVDDAPGGSGGSPGGGAGGGGAAAGGAGGQAAGGGTGGSLCGQNGDFVVERAEITLAPGLTANFLTALDTTFDTAGQPGDEGRVWDLSGTFGGDHLALIETLSIEGAWYASLFPGASYAARLSDTSELLGVFEATEQSLLLRGVVSKTDGLTRTEVTYDPPAVLLSFPLSEGSSWSSTSTVQGLVDGFFSTYVETYDSEVDARGELMTPFGAFDVVRVGTQLTRTVGVIPTVTKTFAFVAECFGTVAKVTSQAGEQGVEFTSAAELSRLSP